MMFKTKGGGGQRLFEQCSKKLQIWWRLAPLRMLLVILAWLLHPHSSRVGRGQKVTAPPPHGRSAHVHGVREEEQGYFLGGNN